MSVNVFQNGQLTPVSASSNEFVGTTEEFNQAVSEGKIKEGMIVNITDDADVVNLVSKDDVISSIKDVVINTNPNKVASSNALKEVYLNGGSNVSEMISDEWNETDEYMVGDYRINDNKVWKCLQDNVGVVPEEGVYWTQVNVTDEVNKLNNNLVKYKDFNSDLISVPANSINRCVIETNILQNKILSITVLLTPNYDWVNASITHIDDGMVRVILQNYFSSQLTGYVFIRVKYID